jgi:LPS-assembly protein
VIAALLALAVAGAAAPDAAPPPLEVIEAGRVDYDVAAGRGVASGGVVLRRGLVLIRADSATYDTRTGEVDAQGGVLLTEPGRVLAAAALHAVLDGGHPYQAREVVAYLKDAPLDLSRCRTLDEARALGRNRATLHGAAARGGGDGEDGEIEIDGAAITLCDCGGGGPSWQLRASRAAVRPGHHAWLHWPVLYLTPRVFGWNAAGAVQIPVLALPVLYLPLRDRQSGLLMPQLTLGGNTGAVLAQPLFLTLGRSYDATLTPAWYFGGARVKGLGGDLELRWAPAAGAAGRLRFSLAQGSGAWVDGVALPPGGDRFALTLLHDQRLSDRTRLDVDLGLVGDALYATDFTADQLLRVADYRRSGAAFTHRRDDALFEADAAYLLPLAHLQATCAGCGRAPFGPAGSDVPVFHRTPSASALLLPVRVAGPLRLSGSAGVARFAPIHGVTGDEGNDGFGPGERGWSGLPDAGEGDGRWQPTERLAATRAAVRAELAAPFTWGHGLALEPWIAGTAAAYALAAGQGSQVDGRVAGGLALSTTLSRAFGEGPSLLRHDVQPRLAWVAGADPAGPGLPNFAYDELDVAAAQPLPAPANAPARRTLSALPGGRFQQAQISLRNRLWRAGPAGWASTSLDVTLGQDVDLAAGRLSETWAQGSLHLGPVSADAGARFYAFGAGPPAGAGPATAPLPRSFFDAFTSLHARLAVADPHGDDVHASLLAVGEGGSPRLLAGLEPLFDPRPNAFDALAIGGVGAVGRTSGATLTYDALYYARSLPSPPCAGKSTDPHFFQQSVSALWDSPCHCWRAGLTAVLNECLDRPQLQFLIDLSSLAERGFGR